MKNRRFWAFSAAVLLLLTALLTACSTGDSQNEETTKAEVGSTEGTDARLPSSLPENLKFTGEEINIWYFTQGDDPSSESFIDLKGDMQGDSVSSAIYARNIAVEDQLGITLNYIDAGVTSGGVGTAVRTQIMSDSSDYDLYNVIQWNSAILATENLFLDISEAEYLDLEKPWWSQSYMNDLSVGDVMYFLAGDITLDMIRCNAAMYYNKRIYTELYGNGDALYQTVLDGDWTLERLAAIVEEAYTDSNNNSRVDAEDRLGLMANNFNNVDAFTFGAGTVLTTRDENNYLTITAQDEHNVDVYDLTHQLYYNTPGMFIEDTDVTTPLFVEGKSLFFAGFLYTSEYLREMKDNYGIVPYPKFNKVQKDYVSVVHDLATLMCLPTTCEKVDAVCATLEAMAYYNHYEVTPEYYGTALKSRYIRDSQSAQMVDIIHEAAMTDFAYVYSGSLNHIGMIMRNLIMEKGTNYSSRAKGLTRSAETALDKLIASFEE